MSIESRLKEEVSSYISKNNLTLKQLAAQVGLTPGSLYNYMNGVSHPGNKLRERLKNVGIDTDYILTGRRAEDTARFNPLQGMVLRFGSTITASQLSRTWKRTCENHTVRNQYGILRWFALFCVNLRRLLWSKSNNYNNINKWCTNLRVIGYLNRPL